MNEAMNSHQIFDSPFYKEHSPSASGSQPCLDQRAAAHLADAHGTPVCHGTPVKNHCYKASITVQGLPEPSLGTRAAKHKGCN